MKSVAQTVLAIAKQKEAKRFRTEEENFKAFIGIQLKKDMGKLCQWEESTFGKGYHTNEIQISFDDLKKIAQKLGFVIKEGIVIIPERNKKEKMSWTQQKVYHYKIEYNKKIKEQQRKERQICQEVIEKLRKGEFENVRVSVKETEVKVLLSKSSCIDPKSEEILKMIRKYSSIRSCSIDKESGEWKIRIRAR